MAEPRERDLDILQRYFLETLKEMGYRENSKFIIPNDFLCDDLSISNKDEDIDTAKIQLINIAINHTKQMVDTLDGEIHVNVKNHILIKFPDTLYADFPIVEIYDRWKQIKNIPYMEELAASIKRGSLSYIKF